MLLKTVKCSVLLFVTLCACAMAAEPAARLFINGKASSTEVKIIEGRYYLSLEDLSRALGATTTITAKPGEATTISLGIPVQDREDPSKIATGSISGVITYFFNDNFGSKPDTGSKITVVNGRVTIAKTSFLILAGPEIFTPATGDKPAESMAIKVIASATADGTGRYELKDIAQGEYTVIIESQHRTGRSLRDIKHQTICIPIRVNAGQSVSTSWDFKLDSID